MGGGGGIAERKSKLHLNFAAAVVEKKTISLTKNPKHTHHNESATTTKQKQPFLGAFNTESSQDEEEVSTEVGGGGGIGDLVAALLLGGSKSSSSSSPALPPTRCPPSAPLRDSLEACVPSPPQSCSSAQPHCASCDSSWEGPEGFASCLRCEEGFFTFSSAFVSGGGGESESSDGGFGSSTAGARSCLECSSLRCAKGKGSCGDGKGCVACPEGLRLERKSKSAPFGCV